MIRRNDPLVLSHFEQTARVFTDDLDYLIKSSHVCQTACVRGREEERVRHCVCVCVCVRERERE